MPSLWAAFVAGWNAAAQHQAARELLIATQHLIETIWADVQIDDLPQTVQLALEDLEKAVQQQEKESSPLPNPDPDREEHPRQN